MVLNEVFDQNFSDSPYLWLELDLLEVDQSLHGDISWRYTDNDWQLFFSLSQ